MDGSARVCFADEMRLGLVSQLRRRWCPRGVRLVQSTQMRFEWRWLSLALDPLTGRLVWRWQANLRKEAVSETVLAWQSAGVDTVLWDNAPGHKARLTRTCSTRSAVVLGALPPFSPELNPVERLFEEVRRAVEGPLYETLEAKVAAVETFLLGLAADAERVKRLCGWDWIVAALSSLPDPLRYHGA